MKFLAHYRNLVYIVLNDIYNASIADDDKQCIRRLLLSYNPQRMLDDNTFRRHLSNAGLQCLHQLSTIKPIQQQIWRQAITDFDNTIRLRSKGYYANFPRPRKLKYLTYFSAQFPKGSFAVVSRNSDKKAVRITLSRRNYIFVPLPNINTSRISSIRLCLILDDVYVNILVKDEEKITPTKKRYIYALDPGVKNLVSIVRDDNMRPIVIRTGPILDRLRWFSKTISQLQSKKYRVHALYRKGKRWLKSILHQLSSDLVKLFVYGNAKLVLVGSGFQNKNQMAQANFRLGNRMLYQFPHQRLFMHLQYKLAQFGIEVKFVDESYTSRTSPLGQVLRRNKAGVHVKTGDRVIHIHADVNAAYSLLMKVTGTIIGKIDNYANPHVCVLNYGIRQHAQPESGRLWSWRRWEVFPSLPKCS